LAQFLILAIESTHPKLIGTTDLTAGFFDKILAAYQSALEDPKAVLDRFEQVRSRGRKRVAFG
jgi:tRNA A-37 threonylcarbamoyl transferase component Bud32